MEQRLKDVRYELTGAGDVVFVLLDPRLRPAFSFCSGVSLLPEPLAVKRAGRVPLELAGPTGNVQLIPVVLAQSGLQVVMDGVPAEEFTRRQFARIGVAPPQLDVAGLWRPPWPRPSTLRQL